MKEITDPAQQLEITKQMIAQTHVEEKMWNDPQMSDMARDERKILTREVERLSELIAEGNEQRNQGLGIAERTESNTQTRPSAQRNQP